MALLAVACRRLENKQRTLDHRRHLTLRPPANSTIGNRNAFRIDVSTACSEDGASCSGYRHKAFSMRVAMTSPTDGITIGELSKRTGVHIETIRYYERIKMLPKPPRTTGGRRTYGSTHLRLLAFIRRSRELGFSPDDVRKLLRLGGPDKASCRQVRDIATDHLNDIRARIADLRKLERLLAKTVAKCTGTTASECPVLDVLDVQRRKKLL